MVIDARNLAKWVKYHARGLGAIGQYQIPFLLLVRFHPSLWLKNQTLLVKIVRRFVEFECPTVWSRITTSQYDDFLPANILHPSSIISKVHPLTKTLLLFPDLYERICDIYLSIGQRGSSLDFSFVINSSLDINEKRKKENRYRQWLERRNRGDELRRKTNNFHNWELPELFSVSVGVWNIRGEDRGWTQGSWLVDTA